MTRKRRRPLRRAAVGLERWRSGGSGRRTHSANAAGAATATHSAPIFVLFSSCETLLPSRRGVGGSDSTGSRGWATTCAGLMADPSPLAGRSPPTLQGGRGLRIRRRADGGDGVRLQRRRTNEESVIDRALQGNLYAGRRMVTWYGPMPLSWARCLTAGAVCPTAPWPGWRLRSSQLSESLVHLSFEARCRSPAPPSRLGSAECLSASPRGPELTRRPGADLAGECRRGARRKLGFAYPAQCLSLPALGGVALRRSPLGGPLLPLQVPHLTARGYECQQIQVVTDS